MTGKKALVLVAHGSEEIETGIGSFFIYGISIARDS